MNTLPIGFVLAQAATAGQCALILDIADTHPQRPPRLRLTVNGAVFDRELRSGGSEDSLRGNLNSAKPQVVEVKFPATLLKPGYNEIALRSTGGSWLVFDALHLEAPAEVRLASPANTVIRSVSTPAYAVSASRKAPATIRVEVFRAGAPGKLQVQIERGTSQVLETEPGLQVFEVAAPASAPGKSTHVRVSAEGQLLHESSLSLQAAPSATPADYVDVFKGTANCVTDPYGRNADWKTKDEPSALTRPKQIGDQLLLPFPITVSLGVVGVGNGKCSGPPACSLNSCIGFANIS
jgi:Polysaccharide lyase family 4, domain III